MRTCYILDELDAFLGNIRHESSLFIGSLGFEDRTLGARSCFDRNGFPARFVFLVSYGATYETKGHRERSTKQNINRKTLLTQWESKQVQFVDCHLDNPWEAIDQVEGLLHEGSYNYLFLDITTMPKSVLFPLYQRLAQVYNGSLVALYSTPEDYTEEPLFYELGTPIVPSGFEGNGLGGERPDVWIPVLGFEGEACHAILEWGRFDKILPIIAFPGYRAGYVDRVLHSNREFLQDSNVEQIYYSSANNPFQAKNLIEKLRMRFSDFNVTLSPMGPKPHSLGLCMAAIENNLQVVYAQPWAYNPNYSMGYRTSYAYLIRRI